MEIVSNRVADTSSKASTNKLIVEKTCSFLKRMVLNTGRYDLFFVHVVHLIVREKGVLRPKMEKM
jgi:hypothetical protein